ncbi:WD40-repeat-containing domain protein [Suillus bovinus]|uniref:WD40-repeat-containing domain protein n=1 Tax=Suillus bovinus TaxID=48563 RepID=UPI001B8753C3|nr:WD40-repeat-containing domain protein [Suillus bovinus]KAG2159789.1 WD40-repeat-containing domain protein [Suillus bovinus]
MSVATPAASSSGGVSPVNASAPDVTQNVSSIDRLVLEYLRSRGHKDAERALNESLESGSADESGKTVSAEDLIKTLAVYAQKPSRPGDNVLKESANVLQELTAMGNPPSIQNLIASLGTVGAEEILSVDPTDKEEGFRELEAWVEGSLDMYKPEFRPILFPIFCHFHLDLVQRGFKEAALRFYATYSPSLSPMHHSTLHHLSTLLLPSHVQNDDDAQRFKNEKYVIRMSRSGFSLLVGWLTEGVGGEATGAGDGFSGEKGKRGRAAIMRVVNNHLRFDVTSASATAVSPNAWEESTGLLSQLIPQTSASATPNPHAFNASKGELKLGPAPISEELRTETERVIREQSVLDRDPNAQYDLQFLRPPAIQGVVSPTESDMLPYPQSFKTVDVQREVEKVRDARKRIRLEPSALSSIDMNSVQGGAARARGLPSICAYTLHDVGEGAPCCTFSPDLTLMAAGFSESYIRLWSLKNEKLKGLRNDFSLSSVKDSGSLSKIQQKEGNTTRKLVGHSGPVYSLSFDPLGGSAAPPRYLLSASADATTRLWSLDTMTNVVAFRGHQNPVWDVQWSPMGIYFATASRDRTARLWSTDRTSCLRIYAGHLSDVDCVRFHPNSLYLATGSSDWTARLWDVQRGACVRVFIGHQGSLSTLAISPDGRYLASAGEDLAINLWDLGSGRRVKKMTGHTASVYSLSFSAESSMLVSGGADWTVRCWDVRGAGGPGKSRESGAAESPITRTIDNENNETSDLLATFPTKRTPITNVHFTPRNLCLVAGNYLAPDSR